MSEEKKQQEKIKEIFRELGIPVNILGHQYCLDGIMFLLKQKQENKGRMKMGELYKSVAEKNSATPSQVERCVRHAIEKGKSNSNLDVWYKYFGNTFSVEKGPTSGQFIVTIAMIVSS